MLVPRKGKGRGRRRTDRYSGCDRCGRHTSSGRHLLARGGGGGGGSPCHREAPGVALQGTGLINIYLASDTNQPREAESV